MARVEVELPPAFQFRTELAVRIHDVNYGGHVGHDTLLGLVHEARVQLLATHGFTELDIDGVGIAVVDSVTVHAAEARHGMTLVFDLAVGDLRPRGFALFCRVSDRASGREVARVRMGHVFFDYRARKVTRTPPCFREAFGGSPHPDAEKGL